MNDVLFAGGEMERTAFWDAWDGDIIHGGLEKKMDLVVWELL